MSLKERKKLGQKEELDKQRKIYETHLAES